MRLFLLLLTLFSVPGWSQGPAQQPAQPPIVVKVETPPTNPWVHLVDIVVPGIVGAGIAFLGVWWTNRRNAAENAANRAHQLQVEIAKDKIAAEAKSRDNRWAFRKSLYCRLIDTTSELISNLATFRHTRLQGGITVQLEERRWELTRELMNNARLAPLATADGVLDALEAAKPNISGASIVFGSPDEAQQITDTIIALDELLKSFQSFGRKDLWGTPESEAKG